MTDPKKKKIAFIINPKSGRRTSKLKKESILKHLNTAHFQPLFFLTEYAGHAGLLAASAATEGCEIVVAVGGDGTVNEVAAALVNLGTPLGILPSGSGNGLARHLNIPIQWSKAIKVIEQGKSMHIDGGTLNGSWFFNNCGIGFDARIGHKFSKVSKRGFVSYIETVLKEYAGYKPRNYTFWVDNKKFIRKAFVITVANSSQYGNNAFIAPDAKINDGLFDVCVVNEFPIHEGLNLGIRLFNRTIQHSKYHEIIKGENIRFKKSKKKYNLHFDGEAIKLKKKKINIEMHPEVLPVIIP